MSFLNPIWLYGLFGMAVPLAIHLWSKKEGRIIKVGSLQHFPKGKSRKSSSLSINEIWLLILRMGIIALLSILLTQPVIFSDDQTKVLMLIDPELSLQEQKQILDTADMDKYEVRYLDQDLTPIDESYTSTNTDYWRILTDLDVIPNEEVVVISGFKLVNIRGKRPSTGKNVKYIQLPGREEKSGVIESWLTGDKLKLIKVNSDDLNTRNKIESGFEIINADSLESGLPDEWVAIKMDTLRIWQRIDKGFEKEDEYVKTAINTIARYLGRHVEWHRLTEGAELSHEDWVIWLSEESHKIENNRVIFFRERPFARELIVSSDDGFIITSRLDDDLVIAGDLIGVLSGILFTSERQYQLMDRYDQRRAYSSQYRMSTGKDKARVGAAIPMTNIVLYILLGVLGIERLLSFIRRQ